MHDLAPPPRIGAAAPIGDCSNLLHGSPCIELPIGEESELIMNFGHDNGLADWDLTELILGWRAAIRDAGLASPEFGAR